MIVGLGNPGNEYANTRHNVGFRILDELAQRRGIASWKNKHGARQAFDSRAKLVLVEPTSFMNKSGVPVRVIASWYRVPATDTLVVVDDMDLPFGKLRMRAAGGHGGHNGLRSIIATMGEDFPRLRVGIGRPEFDGVDHVLSSFSESERAELQTIVAAATDGIEHWIEGGTEAAMQWVNSWRIVEGT